MGHRPTGHLIVGPDDLPPPPLPPPPPSTGNFVLPVSGTWRVIQAPPCPFPGSNHCATRSQIYAIDVVAVSDSNGAPVNCTGRPVFAPTAGDVVSAIDGQPDIGGSNPDRPAGNHVVIRRSPQEFVFVAHLQQGTVAVSAGTPVTAGQMIGRCGNSGNSSGPHVHFHMQSTPGVLDYSSATALPIVFDRVVGFPGEPMCDDPRHKPHSRHVSLLSVFQKQVFVPPQFGST